MLTRFVLISAAVGFTAMVSAFSLLTSPAENYYAARVARGGDPAFGDIGSAFYGVCILAGLAAFGFCFTALVLREVGRRS